MAWLKDPQGVLFDAEMYERAEAFGERPALSQAELREFCDWVYGEKDRPDLAIQIFEEFDGEEVTADQLQEYLADEV